MSNAVLQGARDFVLNNPQFNQTTNVAPGSGLEKLLKASMPEAFHDSGARDPPRCHPGTRLNYIDKISSWGSGTSQQHHKRILWMEGPAGVGKSAIAQTCAEHLAERNHLGAAFFFSRPNQRDDPKRLFPSLSYQITTKSTSFRNIVDLDIQNDPTLVDKSLGRQFHELLVRPLLEVNGTKEYVMIIDGLDECAGINTQREIIETIATSVQDGTTPFRWAFFSRPESHIIASFASDRVRPISLHLELPVSRDIDHEILSYLTAELKKIREENGLPSSWPSERDLGILVDRSAGLYIYASTVVRVVGDRNSSGPIAQLRRIISLPERAASDATSGHPLSALDQFYKFILQCVPPNTLRLLQKILLLNDVMPRYSPHRLGVPFSRIANAISLSEPEFRNARTALRSVLNWGVGSWNITFYHASFMDFLTDPQRSGEFCIFGTCLDAARQDLLEHLNLIHAQGTSTWQQLWLTGRTVYSLTLDLTWPDFGSREMYISCVAAGLVTFQFMTMNRLYNDLGYNTLKIDAEALKENIPIQLRNKVIRQSYNPAVYYHKPKLARWSEHYVLGQGSNRVVWWPGNEVKYIPERLLPYPSNF